MTNADKENIAQPLPAPRVWRGRGGVITFFEFILTIFLPFEEPKPGSCPFGRQMLKTWHAVWGKTVNSLRS
jgi:hypothetical protein